MKKRTTVLTVLALDLFLAATVFATDRAALRVGDPLPSQTLPALVGPVMTIPDDVKGKVTIIHFWTDWCGSCGVVMPALDLLYVHYQQKGLQIISINMGQEKGQVKKFIDKLKISYPVLMDRKKVSVSVYSVIGMPRTYILDRKGIVRYKFVGEVPEEEIRKFVLNLL